MGEVKVVRGVVMIYLGCSGRGKSSGGCSDERVMGCSGRGKYNGGCIDNLVGM